MALRFYVHHRRPDGEGWHGERFRERPEATERFQELAAEGVPVTLSKVYETMIATAHLEALRPVDQVE